MNGIHILVQPQSTLADDDILAKAIRTRWRRKCIARDTHTENCQRCGIADDNTACVTTENTTPTL